MLGVWLFIFCSMRIVLTGGGTGGHFYPLMAVADQIAAISREQKLIAPDLIYMAPTEYDKEALFERNITFIPIAAGKQRRYTSFLNITDLFKIAWGIVKATFRMYFVLPDVVFSKGGYASVPVLFAARFFRIPVIIHESDSVPGRANAWAAKFAKRIAISYPETAEAFEKLAKKTKKEDVTKIALTGNPVRHTLETLAPAGAYEFLKLEKGIPTLLVLGGSSGAETINEALVEALPRLVEQCNVIHQTGDKHLTITRETARLILEHNPNAERYRPFGFLNVLAMRMAGGIADIVITRAGSGAIFETAAWQKPSIIIPIPEDVSHDQRKNAFAYARNGAAVVIEQANLTPNIIVSEVERILGSEETKRSMAEAAKRFARPDAARVIAQEILDEALVHES